MADTPVYDDKAAIEAAGRGDADGIAALYEAYSPLLFGVAQRILGDRTLAEEVVRDVFLEVWTKASNYDPSGCDVRVWLLMHLRQRALERLRSGKASKMVSMEDTQISYVLGDDEAPSLTPDREQIQRIIDLLPPKQRNMLQLAYFEGLSSEKIGARTKVPTTRVASEIANSLQTIRDAITG